MDIKWVVDSARIHEKQARLVGDSEEIIGVYLSSETEFIRL